MWQTGRVINASQILKDRRTRNAGVAVGIVAAHLAVFAVIGRARPSELPVIPTIVEVVMIRPTVPPPPPPPPPPEPSVRAGGGAPAAASRIHVPPPPAVPPPDAPPAPVIQAPKPELTVGVAPVASPTPGFGLGGEGEGRGTGFGEGDGPGSGMGPMIVRGASSRQILDATPRDLRRRARGADVSVSCEVGLDQRLRGCRVVGSRNAEPGFDVVAERLAEQYFQVRPARTGAGEPIRGGRITIGIIWP